MTFLFSKTERYLQKLVVDAKKAARTKRLARAKRLWLTFAICASLLLLVLAVTFSGIGMISQVEARVNPSQQEMTANIPTVVLQDARTLAAQRYGQGDKADTFYDQVLKAFQEARDEDVVIFFNPGGWGTKNLNASPDWVSIIEGMQKDIAAAGFRVSTLNYLRTTNNLRGQLNELKEMATAYKNKAGGLADLVNFLTAHNQDLKIILAAESTGTIICDETMKLLASNTRVFSVQTGIPFWYKYQPNARTILLKDNGKVADSFSRGDLWTILKCSFKSLVVKEKAESEGTILGFLSAPGHEYWWQDPGVCPTIESFLQKNCHLCGVAQTVN
jgi:hypothetical protein